MRVPVQFHDQTAELDVPDDVLIGSWSPPASMTDDEATHALSAGLDSPIDLPALGQSVVPGDRVTLALDASLPEPGLIVGEILRHLESAGVDRGDAAVVTAGDIPRPGRVDWPGGVSLRRHDAEDRAEIAYLAATKDGRRVYLGKALTDADVVIAIGAVQHVPGSPPQGPWSTLFPGMSDAPTQLAVRRADAKQSHDPHHAGRDASLLESEEVSWLLGSLFQVGVVPGADGPAEVMVGREQAVREAGVDALERLWTFHAPERAELVIASVGRPGAPTTLADVAHGLATARQAVRRGGKIVILSDVSEPFGPAMQRLQGLEDSSEAPGALKEAREDDDYAVASQFARASGWAKVYLLSGLDESTVEELGLVPLTRASEAERLAARARSCLVLSQAERTIVRLADAT